MCSFHLMKRSYCLLLRTKIDESLNTHVNRGIQILIEELPDGTCKSTIYYFKDSFLILNSYNTKYKQQIQTK